MSTHLGLHLLVANYLMIHTFRGRLSDQGYREVERRPVYLSARRAVAVLEHLRLRESAPECFELSHRENRTFRQLRTSHGALYRLAQPAPVSEPGSRA